MKLPVLRRQLRVQRRSAARRRFGLVGLGEAARNIHVPACLELADVELVAGADPSDTARARAVSLGSAPARFAQAVPGARTFADTREMFARERLDWVIVATPPATHLDVCVAALEAGVHVFCEKPFVVRAEDAAEIAAAANQAGRVVAINHEFAYMPIFAALQRLVASAELGPLTFLQFWQHVLEHSPGDQHWRAENLTLREFGTHAVDLAVGFYGALPERVFACMASPGGRPGSDLVDVVTLQFPGGRLCSLVLDRVCHGPHRYLELRADGTRASYRASFGGRAALGVDVEARSRRPRLQLDLAAGGQAWLESAEGRSRRVVARNGFNPFAAATAELIVATLDAVERGEAPPVGVRRAEQIVRLVDTIYMSAQRGEALPFSGEFT